MTRLITGHYRCHPCRDSSVTYVVNSHTSARTLAKEWPAAVGPTKGRKARSVPVPTFVLDELSVHVLGRGCPRMVASQNIFPLLDNDVDGKLSGGHTLLLRFGDSIYVVIYLTNRAIVCPSHTR
jgi:hypothetical protein